MRAEEVANNATEFDEESEIASQAVDAVKDALLEVATSHFLRELFHSLEDLVHFYRDAERWL